MLDSDGGVFNLIGIMCGLWIIKRHKLARDSFATSRIYRRMLVPAFAKIVDRDFPFTPAQLGC